MYLESYHINKYEMHLLMKISLLESNYGRTHARDVELNVELSKLQSAKQ